jgi:hypothetical protein
MDANALKKTFFDTAAVADKLPPAIRAALSKFGAYTRRAAKNSLKYGDKPSPPGRPPTVHRSKKFTREQKSKGKKTLQASSPYREFIFFSYDAERKTVVIGPALGGSRSGVPDKIEHGGTSVVIRGDGRRETIHTAPRPTMGLAFEATLDSAAGNFKNLIR